MGIGIEYYAFALFVAGLICIIAIICKVLFSNIKRQQKLLDERESQILQLYTTVETIMEEFNDQVKATLGELKEHEYRAASRTAAFELPPQLEKKEQALEKLPRTLPLDANRIRVAGEVLERAERIIKNEVIAPPVTGSANNSFTTAAPAAAAAFTPASPPVKEDTGAVFQKFFDDSAEALPPETAIEASSMQKRSEAIIQLAKDGKSDVEIASTLGITRNEVQLVKGLTQ